MQPRKSASPAPVAHSSKEPAKPANKKPSHLRLVSYDNNDDNAVSDNDDNDPDDDDGDGEANDGSTEHPMDQDAADEAGAAAAGQANDDPSAKESASDGDAASNRDKASEYGFQLPPEPKGKCPPELQDKIANMHAKMKQGMDMNRLIQERKEFRNPSIYEKLIQFCDINELGTNYPPEIYDPLQWGNRFWHWYFRLYLNLGMIPNIL